MKRKSYHIIYTVLQYLSQYFNIKYVNQLKITIGTTLLLSTSINAQEKKTLPTSEQQEPQTNVSITNTLKSNLEKIEPEEGIFCYVTEVMPEFPDGSAAMFKFIVDNIRYSQIETEIFPTGRVVVQFVVDTDGSIKDIVVVRSLSNTLDSLAMDVVSKMPKWKPGTQRGKVVKTKYTVPINFKSEVE